jgi:hypothetical protein
VVAVALVVSIWAGAKNGAAKVSKRVSGTDRFFLKIFIGKSVLEPRYNVARENASKTQGRSTAKYVYTVCPDQTN